MGSFDDIAAVEGGGSFDDVPLMAKAAAPKKRQVGAVEAGARGVGSTFAEQGNVLGLAGATPFILADAVANLVRKQPSTAAQDFYFGDVYEPTVKNAVEHYEIKPDEQMGVPATVANIGGRVAGMVPSMVAGGGAQQSVMLPRIIDSLFRGAVAAQPSFAVPSTVNRAQQLLEAGVDPETVAKASASNWALNTAMGAAPVSVPGRVLTRAGTGAGINVAGGAAQRGAEGAILGDENAKLAQPAFGGAEMGTDAAIGAVMAALLGQRAAVAPRAQPRPTLDLEPMGADRAPYAGPTDSDPQAALKAVSEALFRTPDGAPTAPDLRLVPKDAEMNATSALGEPYAAPRAPDLSTSGTRADLEAARRERQQSRAVEQPAVVAVRQSGEAIPLDAEGRPIDQGSIAGKLQNDLAARAVQESEARRAFDVSMAQRERKQGAQDAQSVEGQPRDLRESRAGGSTSREGSDLTAPEAFNFLDVKRRAGKVTGTGPEVEIHGDTTVKNAQGKEEPGHKVSYTRELPDGGRERVYEDVPQSRVSQIERPKGPRFAQDINESSYAPPRGTGTGEQQPKPREAAQRITTEPSPEFIPAERAAQRGEATRAGRDVTEHAFNRLEDRGAAPMNRGEPLRLKAPQEARPVADATTERDSIADFEVERDQQFKKNVADDMRSLAKTAGWIERGGQVVRRPQYDGDPNPPVVDRTKWLGQEWFQAMRQGLGRKGLSDKDSIARAVDKWLAGEQMTPTERRTVNYMLDEVMSLREQAEFSGLKMEDAQAADIGLAHEGEERTPQNLYDVDYLSRVDPDVVERLAMQHGDDTDGFMRAVAEEAKNGKDDSSKAGVADESRASVADGEGAAPRPDAGTAGRPQHESGVRKAGGEPEQPRADASESRPEFDLERPGEQQLRARDVEQQRAAEQRRRVENAPPPEEFKLAGSDRPADQAAAAGQKGLFDQGTLSANPFANPKVIAEAVKWTFGDAKAWKGSLDELANALSDLGKKTKGAVVHNPVVAFTRAVFDSAAGDMRSVAQKLKSKTMHEVLDQFAPVPGEGRATAETYHSAVRSYINRNLVELHKMLGDMVNDRDKMKQVASLVRNPTNIKPGTPIHDAAQGIRSMLDAALKHMKAAGVDVGEVKGGYYPREFDVDAVMRDGKGFIEAAATAYRDAGMTPEAARLAAKELHDGFIYGETSTLFRTERGATSAPFLKGRVFGKGIDSETHPLNRFLISDPALALGKYFERVAKRAEIARRFGDNFEKWKDTADKITEEGGGAGLQKLTDYVAMSAGIKKPGVSEGALRASSIARTWGALMFLEKATLSSISEFVVPAIRAGNVLDVGRSFKNTVVDLFGKTKSADERRAFAEDLGLISGHISSALASARFAGGEPMGRVESQVLDRFFKRTGLNQWTDATRVAGADIARTFIRRLAKDMEKDGNLSKRYLAELGVPTEQAKDFAAYVMKRGDGMPTAGMLDGSLGDVYRVAVRKFVAGAIMDPNSSSRPKWMNHPLGAVVGQLQAFNYAFYENVLKRNMRLLKDAATDENYTMAERAQMVMPTLMLPMLVAVAYGVGEARDAVFGDPEKRAKETGTEKIIKAVSRGAPIAPIDPFVNYLTAARYGRSFTEAASGPVLSTAGRILDKVRDAFLKNSPNTNTQERAAYKAVWDIFIEPTVNLMLFASPVSLAAATVTQLAGSGRVREKLFIDPLAGEEKKKNERSAGREAGRETGRSAGRK